VFNPSNSVHVNYDRNSAGTIAAGGVMTGAYDMQLNGRGTLNLDDVADGSSHIWLIYATAPNAGYVMDISSGTVGVGQLVPQLNLPFSNATLIGTYVLGSDEPIVKGTALVSGVEDFDGSSSKLGTGDVSGAQDMIQSTTLSPNQVLTGTYSVSMLSNNGRGSILLTSPASENIAIWAAGPSVAFGLQLDTTAKHPTVLHIDQ